MSFFENTRKPAGFGGKLMVVMMNLGHSPVEFNNHLKCHKINCGILNTCCILSCIFHLISTVCTININLISLLHNILSLKH